jgi:hypothetical protein
MRKPLVLGLAVCALCGCTTMYYKPGATAQEGKEAIYNCERDVSQSRLDGHSNGVLFRDCMNAQGWYAGTGAPRATAPGPVTAVPGADQIVVALPSGFALRPAPENLKALGAVCYAINGTLDIGVAVIPLRHEGVADLAAFAATRRASESDTLKDATWSEVTRVEIGGRNAAQFRVTGMSGKLKITFVSTFIEGRDQIVLVNAWTGASNAVQQMTLLESLAAIVSGIT